MTFETLTGSVLALCGLTILFCVTLSWALSGALETVDIVAAVVAYAMLVLGCFKLIEKRGV